MKTTQSKTAQDSSPAGEEREREVSRRQMLVGLGSLTAVAVVAPTLLMPSPAEAGGSFSIYIGPRYRRRYRYYGYRPYYYDPYYYHPYPRHFRFGRPRRRFRRRRRRYRYY